MLKYWYQQKKLISSSIRPDKISIGDRLGAVSATGVGSHLGMVKTAHSVGPDW